jgi:hypothetical protein
MPQVIGKEVLVAIKPIIVKSQHPPTGGAKSAMAKPSRSRPPPPSAHEPPPEPTRSAPKPKPRGRR